MSSPRLTGELVKWAPDRGFGFVRPDSGDHDIFVSLAALAFAGIETPATGERFSFAVDTDRHGRARATDLRREGG